MISTIDHKVRKGFDISITEYIVCDVIHRSQYTDYCTLTKSQISNIVDVTTSTVQNCVNKLADMGLVEIINHKPLNTKVTKDWVDALITREVTQNEAVGDVAIVGKKAIEYLNKKLGKKDGFKYATYQTKFKNLFQNYRKVYGESMDVDKLSLGIQAVVDFKYIKWAADPDMEQYLRPSTLFGSKFMSYLDEARIYWKSKR